MRPYGPLRGRDEVLATALGIVRRTRVHGASGVVLITGEPGIGKTALLSEICRQASHTRVRVARSKCDEIEQACAGAPIIGLLRSGRDPLLTAAQFQEIVGLAREPLILVDRIAGHLEQLAAVHRLMIAVDDVQWADRLSRYALRSLIARLSGRPVVWVLASRSDDAGLTVSAADTVGVEHLRLDPLPRAVLAELARDRLGNSLHGGVDELLDAAGGNPLLATHIIDGAARYAETGRDEDIPAEFRAAVYQRLDGLSSTATELIEALAAAGRAVSITELPAVCDAMPGGQHDDAVTAVLASGLVTLTAGELSFGHDLVREAVYERLSTEKRRRLHGRLARHFAGSGADPVSAGIHARAAAAFGDESNARIMVAAAEALVTTSAVDAADLALQAFATLSPGQPYWLELGERTVSVLSGAQRANDTIAVADRLLATVDDVDTISRIQTHGVKALWLSGRIADLIDRAEHGLALSTGRPDLAARFQAAHALAATRTLGADAAADQANAALSLARTSRDGDAIALALQAAGEAAHAQRRHQLALKHFRELRSVTRNSYLAEEIMELQLLDRYHDAQILLDAAREDSDTKSESLLPDLLFAQAKQHYNLGHLPQADQVAETVVELGQLVGNMVQVVEGTLIRAFVALLRGQAALAEQRLGLAIDITGGHRAHPGVTFTQGWLTALQGDLDNSRQILSQLLAAPHQSRSYWAWWPCWMTILFEVGIACSATDFTERAIEVAEEGARHNPDVATLTGLALNMRGLFNRDSAMVAESVKVLQHSPRRVLRAIGAEGYGGMLLDAGQREAALHQLDAAWDDYDHMGACARRAAVQRVMRQAGARRAKWVRDHNDPQPRSLTEAERRVAYLVADGHTDKAAARALGVSVNTVGTHLRSIYSKLAVQSRVQLANALRERGELN
ncbi:helix-turn-helix transcriptional regulator [Mycobacterium sp.]|uniref:helix-turn-helix transcriptional regulator n=1 Tax=Mycobacterium sp. TaxID=1785 RepID=UPI003F96154B